MCRETHFGCFIPRSHHRSPISSPSILCARGVLGSHSRIQKLALTCLCSRGAHISSLASCSSATLQTFLFGGHAPQFSPWCSQNSPPPTLPFHSLTISSPYTTHFSRPSHWPHFSKDIIYSPILEVFSHALESPTSFFATLS